MPLSVPGHADERTGQSPDSSGHLEDETIRRDRRSRVAQAGGSVGNDVSMRSLVHHAHGEDHVGMEFTHRVAMPEDLEDLGIIMERAIDQLQQGFLTPEEIQSSHVLMGIDTQLVDDGTYYTVLDGDTIAGCGGWSRRATLYGGDHTPGRDPALLDPKTGSSSSPCDVHQPRLCTPGCWSTDPATLRAGSRKRGIHPTRTDGDLGWRAAVQVLRLTPVERLSDDRGGVPVPMVRMTKDVELRPE